MKRLIYLLVALLALMPLALGDICGDELSENSSSGVFVQGYGDTPDIPGKGPYEDGLSPADLMLDEPQEDSLQPDDCVSFRPATPPENIRSMMESTTSDGSGSWYWPGSVPTQNKLYIQTSEGLTTVAGCSYNGHLPLWAKVAYSDRFYVYEWYPNKHTPTVNWWSWSSPSYMKGCFKGDVSGWHIICYHCGHTSNYVYIYVWPQTRTNELQTQVSTTLPFEKDSVSTEPGAPASPDPLSERLMPTNLQLVVPECNYPAGYSEHTGWYPESLDRGSYSSGTISSYDSHYTDQTFKPSDYQVYPSSSVTPPSYNSPDRGLVYTPMAVSRYNEYYVQTWPNRLTTVAGTQRDQWLPIWSRIKWPGIYWSFEWSPCELGHYCRPEVKNFGYKNAGWCPTWFRSDKPGWHLLCYYCNDWSNYIYIYVY
ncbi:MAG: hypothetical protein ACXQT4_03775 [Methanotrichaceae archaeon]